MFRLKKCLNLLIGLAALNIMSCSSAVPKIRFAGQEQVPEEKLIKYDDFMDMLGVVFMYGADQDDKDDKDARDNPLYYYVLNGLPKCCTERKGAADKEPSYAFTKEELQRLFEDYQACMRGSVDFKKEELSNSFYNLESRCRRVMNRIRKCAKQVKDAIVKDMVRQLEEHKRNRGNFRPRTVEQSLAKALIQWGKLGVLGGAVATEKIYDYIYKNNPKPKFFNNILANVFGILGFSDPSNGEEIDPQNYNDIVHLVELGEVMWLGVDAEYDNTPAYKGEVTQIVNKYIELCTSDNGIVPMLRNRIERATIVLDDVEEEAPAAASTGESG